MQGPIIAKPLLRKAWEERLERRVFGRLQKNSS